MNSHLKFSAGDRVYCPRQPEFGFGTIKLIEESLLADEPTLQVAFDWLPGLTSMPMSMLTATLALEGGTSIPANEWGSVGDLQRRVGSTLVMAENSRTGAFIRSFATPLPHQAFLLEKLITHNRFGHVVADDVGMGKTIEAGLIIAAIRQQNPRARFLVLSPAGVVLQWQDEMDEHFGLEFSIAGRDFNANHLPGWNNHALVLASLDTLKQEHYEELLKQVQSFDLIICDEAHRLTVRRDFLSNDLRSTRNYRFVEWLSQQRIVEWIRRGDGEPRSPKLLLLTATPHQGDDLRFAYLLQLARPDIIQAETAIEEGGPLTDSSILEECITRTAKKRAVDWDGKSIFKGHESKTMDVELCAQERNLIEALSDYVINHMQFASGGNALIRALAMHTFQKIAASSWAALEAALMNRLGGVNDTASEFWSNETLANEISGDPGQREKMGLQNLLDLLSSLPGNSKWRLCSELLTPGKGFREAGDRVLIFTQYRRTQEWLAEQLSQAGERVALIHGGLSLNERKEQRTFFETHGTILISTEAGSEGANLHRKCHLEINYDLPWNPMRLLQRIGRLDRYGQNHRVKVVNLRAPFSWDSQVSARIAERLASVQQNMGLVADEDYRAMILGEVHDAIDVASVMQRSDWGRNVAAVDTEVDKVFQNLLARRGVIDHLFQESMGMPEGFSKAAPALSPEHFRQAFAWVASGQDVALKETRTSDNRYLRGVYHFQLPDAFRGGLRASREVYLTFDREIYADVRGEVLGKARGQDIRPSLAGFGDQVTDWFFRSGLHASPGRSVFSLKSTDSPLLDEVWWVIIAARWKQSTNWAGPDAVFCVAMGEDQAVRRPIPMVEVFQQLASAQGASKTPSSIPSLQHATSAAIGELRTILPRGVDQRHLSLFPVAVVYWEHSV